MADRHILVTGGAGFIGTHTVVQLLKEGFKVLIVDNFDNFDNSCMEALDRVRDLVGPQLSKKLEFVLGDLRNKADLENIFSKHKFDAVMHFTGLKAVGESVVNPRRYFDNNLIGTINLYEVMAKYNCKKMVFSSSATVYGYLTKFHVLRTSSDANHGTIETHSTPQGPMTRARSKTDALPIPQGLITRARSKKLQGALSLLIQMELEKEVAIEDSILKKMAKKEVKFVNVIRAFLEFSGKVL